MKRYSLIYKTRRAQSRTCLHTILCRWVTSLHGWCTPHWSNPSGGLLHGMGYFGLEEIQYPQLPFSWGGLLHGLLHGLLQACSRWVTSRFLCLFLCFVLWGKERRAHHLINTIEEYGNSRAFSTPRGVGMEYRGVGIAYRGVGICYIFVNFGHFLWILNFCHLLG